MLCLREDINFPSGFPFLKGNIRTIKSSIKSSSLQTLSATSVKTKKLQLQTSGSHLVVPQRNFVTDRIRSIGEGNVFTHDFYSFLRKTAKKGKTAINSGKVLARTSACVVSGDEF